MLKLQFYPLKERSWPPMRGILYVRTWYLYYMELGIAQISWPLEHTEKGCHPEHTTAFVTVQMKSITYTKKQTLCNASMTDQIKNYTSAIWFPQKEASFLFFTCILSWDREVQYMAFRELYCINPLFLRLLLSELEKTHHLTLNVSQHICLFCFGFFKIWKHLWIVFGWNPPCPKNNHLSYSQSQHFSPCPLGW